MKKAIDMHTHINTGSKFDSSPNSLLYDASLEYLMKMNEAAGIEKMFCSTFSSVLLLSSLSLSSSLYMCC